MRPSTTLHTRIRRALSLPSLLFAGAILTIACRPETKPAQDAPGAPAASDPVAPHEPAASLEYLISSAGSDFRANTAGQIEVRQIRFGLRDTTGGQQSYVLCGEFRPRSAGVTAQWAPFATVETSRYEQWLGETRFCQTLSGEWNTADSLTTRLQGILQ